MIWGVKRGPSSDTMVREIPPEKVIRRYKLFPPPVMQF